MSKKGEAEGQLVIAGEHKPQMMVKAKPEPLTATPMDLINLAMKQSNVDLDKLTRLWELHKEFEDRQAEIEFKAAMARFKQTPIKIIKNKRVHYQPKSGEGQPIDYMYASLDQIVEKISGRLADEGINVDWDLDDTTKPGWIIVSCILSRGLYKQIRKLGGQPDTSGNKNQLKAIASTVSYLQRYTLYASTGLSSSDMDDDGKGGKPQPSKGEVKTREGIEPSSEPNRGHGDEGIDQRNVKVVATDGKKHQVGMLDDKSLITAHKNCSDCNRLMVRYRRGEIKPAGTEQETKEGLITLANEIMGRLWPAPIQVNVRANVGRTLYGVDTKPELYTLSVEHLALALRALALFEEVFGPDYNAPTMDGLIVDVKAMLNQAIKEADEQQQRTKKAKK
jgi:hypothetical protein